MLTKYRRFDILISEREVRVMRTLAIALSIVSLILSSYSLYLSFKNQRNAEEREEVQD